ncbi:trypsin-like peptidase domain-containing protein [Isoptericola jiangsuensis]|uniref:S1C family serine protease n=1 Tax=Isoptericola jiangsuensis TaxID=548579 RepID=UPI003AB05599
MSTDNNPAPQPPSGPENHPVEQQTTPLPVTPSASSSTPAGPQIPQPAQFAHPVPAPPQQAPVHQGANQQSANQQSPVHQGANRQRANQQDDRSAQSAPYQQGSPQYRQSAPQPHPQAPYATGAAPSYPAMYGQPAPQQQTAPTATKQKSRWVPVVAAAAGAAVLASGATVGLIYALDDDGSTSLAQVGTPEQSTTAPVASSTNENPDWQAVTAAVAPSVVAIQVSSQAGGAEGSGVIVDDAGHIVTNNHVVSGAEGNVQVTLSDGRLFEAEIVGTDPTTDLAVVQLVDAPDDLQPATVGDSDAVQVGDSVLAVGNPLGLANTATTGIVSALDRPVAASGEDSSDVVVTNAIQIDAAVNPGNSGGPLFDAQGRVIGITSSIATMSSGSGQSGSIGLGFAIPANLATSVAEQLVEDGTAEHAFLGVSLGDASATADGVTRRGAQIGEVTEGSPAAEAGLQSGDVIVAVDDDAVNGAESLTAYVRERSAGEQATVTYVRDGQTSTVDVTFAVREETTTAGDQGQGDQGQQGQGQQGQGQQGQGQQGQGGEGWVPGGSGQDGSGQDGSDSTQPDNIPDWLQELFGN